MNCEAADLRLSIDVSSVPPRPAGAGRYAIELVSGLSKSGLGTNLKLITTRSSQKFWRFKAPESEIVASVPSARPLRLLYEQVGLGPRLNRLGVQVHHGIHYTMPRGYSGKRVVTIHDMTLIEHPEWHERSKVLFFGRAIRAAARGADAIVCPSYATASRVEQILAPRGDVFVIYHGVDLSWLEIGVETGRDHLPQGLDERFLLYVGTIEPRKDLPTLVRAFEMIAEEDRELKLVVAGQVGWRSDESIQAMEGSRFRDRIVRLNYVDDLALAVLYRSAAAFVYPSIEEGFGLPVIEAMAVGTPVITTQDSVMAEVSKKNAELVPASDAVQLAKGITRVLGGGPEVALRAEKARVIAQSYTWDRSVSAHLAVYRKVVGS